MKTQVTDKIKVFAREMQGKSGSYTSYSTSMGKKDRDGNWENARLFVEFQNGVNPPQNIGDNGVDIELVDAWLTFRNYQPTAGGQPMVDKNGKPVKRTLFGIHVKEWKPIGAAPKETPKEVPLPDSFAIVEEDEPF